MGIESDLSIIWWWGYWLMANCHTLQTQSGWLLHRQLLQSNVWAMLLLADDADEGDDGDEYDDEELELTQHSRNCFASMGDVKLRPWKC